jgi:6-phosphogluconolactonase/glucosamine-6-phosphate isomerase/deaminase
MMSAPSPLNLNRRKVGDNIWLAYDGDPSAGIDRLPVYDLVPEVLESEEAVGRAMLDELEIVARTKTGEVTIALLGGRGAQALHRLLGERARQGDPTGLIRRLRVFTQDALAPLAMKSGFSFVRDFERLLGHEFFEQVKSFTAIRTDSGDLESELSNYLQKLNQAGGLDIFFLGLGPEPADASHLAYIKPGAGATLKDLAGIIPISSSILEHHISKFKAGGSSVNAEDESECRRATHILTLGPAWILGAKRIVQSIVDADTAPGKKASYRRLRETRIASTAEERARQADENPGLWVRFHPNVRSLVLSNLLS